MQGFAEVRARLDLLRAVHPIICSSVPSSQLVADHESLRIQDDTTLLRSDIRILPIKLQSVELDRGGNQNHLAAAVDGLLSLFEDVSMKDAKFMPHSKVRQTPPFHCSRRELMQDISGAVRCSVADEPIPPARCAPAS